MAKAIRLAVLALWMTLAAPVAGARQAPELPSVLVVTKSDNRNELHYGVLMNQACAPAVSDAIRPYWLMRERGPHVTETLSNRERDRLGVTHQDVDGQQIRFFLAGMPARAFVAHVARDTTGSCTSWVDTTVAGLPARVVGVHAKLRFFGIDYVQITGRTPDGKLVQERISP
jgi:hypothetical protein